MTDSRFGMALNEKMRNNKGFTLGEVLVATIIMLLVTVIVMTGIPAAQRAYQNVVDTANSQTLLSTAMSSFRNELATAKDIDIESGGQAISYYNEAFGSVSRISKDEASETGHITGNIMYARYDQQSDEARLIGAAPPAGNEPVSLISKEMSGDNFYVTFDKIHFKKRADGSVDKDVVVIDGLEVKKISPNATVASVPTYSIRVVSK